MSSAIRKLIQNKVAQSLTDKNVSKLSDIAVNLQFKKDSNHFAFLLPLKTKNYDVSEEAERILNNSRDISPEVNFKPDKSLIAFEFSKEALIKQILETNKKCILPPCVPQKSKKIIVEFSSPNIAKPFHVGHLRSTIIGNYISNLFSFLNNDVTKINYLGDWGTQFGYIQLGIELMNISEESINSHPISELYKAYVGANQLAENDPEVARRAREIFQRLENGDEKISNRWETLRKWTMDELRKTYGRLDVNFDEYHWESTYSFKKIAPVIDQLDKLKLLKMDEKERKVVAVNENRNVPLIKSDGSTLYLTRDIAAAIDRHEKYNFDLMYYVVENAQTDHFSNLITILGKMEQPLVDKIRHVKFGKIRGMSTRRGTAVFLSEFLDEARNAMREKQTNAATTKVSLDSDDNSSEILGISAIVIHDLKQRRQRDYEFKWDVALDIKGETGVKLQYTHCRLSSIETNSGVTLPEECDPSLLQEPIVNDLLAKIIQFDDAITASYRTLEPCYLAKYLFDLSHTVNKTLRELRVKGEPTDVASQRLLLYRVSKNVLAKGMKLLGLRPLDKM